MAFISICYQTMMLLPKASQPNWGNWCHDKEKVVHAQTQYFPL